MRYDVTISSVSHGGLVGLRAGDEGQRRVSAILGGTLPAMPDLLSTEVASAIPIARDEWLLSCADDAALFAQLDASLEGRHGVVAVVSDAYCGLRVRGQDALDVMAQVVAIDVGGSGEEDAAVFGRTGVGRASGLVMRNAARDFSIYVDATHARYAQILLYASAGMEV